VSRWDIDKLLKVSMENEKLKEKMKGMSHFSENSSQNCSILMKFKI
jgi:hypothetical protein